MKSVALAVALAALLAPLLLAGSGDACSQATRELWARSWIQQTLARYQNIYQDIMAGRLGPYGQMANTNLNNNPQAYVQPNQQGTLYNNNPQAQNGQQANGQQANGQQANGQQANAQQANGQQANAEQANGQQANAQQANGQQGATNNPQVRSGQIVPYRSS